ncbi:hypothetical protein ACA081_00135 [Candidatus Hodgkinia cicadicola]
MIFPKDDVFFCDDISFLNMYVWNNQPVEWARRLAYNKNTNIKDSTVYKIVNELKVLA